ncbi:unnamed protein product [Urochloa humidicola]
MPQWRAPGAGVLGPRPGTNQALAAAHQIQAGAGGFLNPSPTQSMVPPQLLAALQGMPSPANYFDGGEWFLDTGVSSHMASNPGSSNQDNSSPL